MCVQGIVSDCVAFDHTFHVPSVLKIEDPTTSTKFSPSYSLFGVLSKWQQVQALTLCATTSAEERQAISLDLHRRRVENGVDLKWAYGDCCCADAKWLHENNPETKVFADIHHILSRYKESMPKLHPEKTRVVMSRLASAICGSSAEKKPIEGGKQTYDKMTKVLQDAQAREEAAGVPIDQRVITNMLMHTHRLQETHILHCLPTKDDIQLVKDRSDRAVCIRGTSAVESFWRFLKSRMPESCSMELGLALMTIASTCWNVNKEVQFRPRYYSAIFFYAECVIQFSLFAIELACCDTHTGDRREDKWLFLPIHSTLTRASVRDVWVDGSLQDPTESQTRRSSDGGRTTWKASLSHD